MVWYRRVKNEYAFICRSQNKTDETVFFKEYKYIYSKFSEDEKTMYSGMSPTPHTHTYTYIILRIVHLNYVGEVVI